ncbi:hypothetical protein [Pseudactinotalea terrae]|uniref:hypothetical protein n=1 Tax=Pseudactinotalea terrae TaxID=1743262 RepID=UPI0012E0FE68|nr:hypothetical protein [Pseudactinotalea terrae]
MTAVHLEPAAVTRFVAGTMTDDHERARLSEAVLRALVAGPYAQHTDQDTLRRLFDGANLNLLARLLQERPPGGPHTLLSTFLAHVLSVGAALLRLAADTDSLQLLTPQLTGTAGALPEHVITRPQSLPAHLIDLARSMQAHALSGEIAAAHGQASAGARLVRICAGQLPGTLGPLRDLLDTDLTEADVPAILRDYCDLATTLLTPR